MSSLSCRFKTDLCKLVFVYVYEDKVNFKANAKDLSKARIDSGSKKPVRVEAEKGTRIRDSLLEKPTPDDNLRNSVTALYAKKSVFPISIIDYCPHKATTCLRCL